MCCSGSERDRLSIQPVAYIRTDFKEKFGIPRQPGLVPGLTGTVEFEPEFRTPDVVRGMEDFEYLWLIFGFSENWDYSREGEPEPKWSKLVRPPRLGGKEKKGVFATRSPFRPNGLGMSAVKLLRVDTENPENPLLIVGGADLLDGTPIFDVKPYVPLADCRPQAVGGFSDQHREDGLSVDFPPALLEQVPEEKRAALLGVLAQDPRPSYQHDPQRVYGMGFAGQNVRFTVAGDTLTVRSIDPLEK